MKTLIVGDIHGQAEQFERLLTKARFSPQTDRLILLGDLIDRGPDSYWVIQRAMELKDEMDTRFIIVRGSHEKLFLSNKLRDKLLWRLVGRKATVRSFLQNGEELSLFAGWVRENTVLYYEDNLFQCVHAAVRDEPLFEQSENTLTMNRSLTKKNRYKGKLTVTGHLRLKEPTYFDGNGGKGAVMPYDRTLFLPDSGIICLDTGCGDFGRKLSGMIVESSVYKLISEP